MIFLIPPFIGFNQEKIVITYDLNFVPKNDSRNTDFRSYKLYIDNHQSIFVEENLIRRYEMDDPEYEGIKRFLLNTSFQSFFDDNIIQKEKEVLTFIKFHPVRRFLAYQDDKMELTDWQILPDTATVAGLLSQKATRSLGGRDWEAWFTTEIPISDGPYKFSGLPGLIIKLNSLDGDYNFEIRKIEKLNPDEVHIHLVKYQQMPKADHDKFFNLRYTDPYEITYKFANIPLNQTIRLNGKEITVAEMNENHKKEAFDVNTIEKYRSVK